MAERVSRVDSIKSGASIMPLNNEAFQVAAALVQEHTVVPERAVAVEEEVQQPLDASCVVLGEESVTSESEEDDLDYITPEETKRLVKDLFEARFRPFSERLDKTLQAIEGKFLEQSERFSSVDLKLQEMQDRLLYVSQMYETLSPWY